MKYGPYILLGGGAIYMFMNYSHVDFTADGMPVFIPREKYQGKEHYKEMVVDENGNPIINQDTGKAEYKEITTDRNVEDIFNYDRSSQQLFANSVLNDLTIKSDTPEWQREYLTAHLELDKTTLNQMESYVNDAWQHMAQNREKDQGWLKNDTSYYQAFDDYGDWKAQQEPESAFSRMWNRAVDLAYNKEDIKLSDYNTGYYQAKFGLLNQYNSYDPSSNTNYGGGGSLFEQHAGKTRATNSRWGREIIWRDPNDTANFTNPADAMRGINLQSYQTLDGNRISSTDYVNVKGFGQVKSRELADVTKEMNLNVGTSTTFNP